MPNDPRDNPRPEKGRGGMPNEGVPGTRGRRQGAKAPPELPKELRNRIDIITAAGNINTPGLSSEMVRSLVQTGLKAGLPAKQVLRFIQGRGLNNLGSVGEGTLGAVVNAMAADPQALVNAVRLQKSFQRGNIGEADPDRPYSGANSFQTQLFDLSPGLRDAYLEVLGHKIEYDAEGNAVRVVNLDGTPLGPYRSQQPIDQQTPMNVETKALANYEHFVDPEAEPFVYGDEDQNTLNETVKSMFAARQRKNKSIAYGDYFSYEDITGGGEQ